MRNDAMKDHAVAARTDAVNCAATNCAEKDHAATHCATMNHAATMDHAVRYQVARDQVEAKMKASWRHLVAAWWYAPQMFYPQTGRAAYLAQYEWRCAPVRQGLG